MLTSLSMCCVLWVSCDDPYVVLFPTFYRKKKKKKTFESNKTLDPLCHGQSTSSQCFGQYHGGISQGQQHSLMNMERPFKHLVWFCPKGKNGYYLVCEFFHKGFLGQLIQQLGHLMTTCTTDTFPSWYRESLS